MLELLGTQQYRYVIEHISGEQHCWGDVLSRLVKVPTVPVRYVVAHSPCDADDSLPSLDVIRTAQRKTVDDGVHSFPTTDGQADDSLFCVSITKSDVLWIPSDDKALQTRLMVCNH
ncbi:unnamed protein product, partial [Sphacelaria rigidula]